MKKKLNKFKISFSPNFSSRKKKIKYIIIHYTGMESLSDTLELFISAKSKVSCHWLISRRGVLYKIVEENKVAWHAGISYWKGEKNLNSSSIGIELEGTDDSEFTDEQYNSLKNLTSSLIRSYPNLSEDRLVGHSDIAPGRKSDPGIFFDWKRLIVDV